MKLERINTVRERYIDIFLNSELCYFCQRIIKKQKKKNYTTYCSKECEVNHMIKYGELAIGDPEKILFANFFQFSGI